MICPACGRPTDDVTNAATFLCDVTQTLIIDRDLSDLAKTLVWQDGDPDGNV